MEGEEGPEPSSEGVDSALSVNDFAVGDRVLVWWWGLWWRARIEYVGAASLTVRWALDNRVTSNYSPKLVVKE